MALTPPGLSDRTNTPEKHIDAGDLSMGLNTFRPYIVNTPVHRHDTSGRYLSFGGWGHPSAQTRGLPGTKKRASAGFPGTPQTGGPGQL